MACLPAPPGGLRTGPRPGPVAWVRWSGMSRTSQCARPGCGGAPTAVLTYHYASRTVWLDDLGEVDGSSWSMCAGHADNLRVPVGWACEDRRVKVRSLRPPIAV